MFTAALLLSIMLPQAIASQRAVAAPAMQVRPVPDDAVRRQSRLAAGLAPTVRAKLVAASQSMTQRLRVLPTASVAQMQGAAEVVTKQAFPNAQGADLDTLVFLVMSEAAQAQQADLQQQMNQMQQQTKQKQNERGSQGEMSQQLQIELQMAMDRRNKFLEALSNVMKKTTDTQSSVIQNMK